MSVAAAAASSSGSSQDGPERRPLSSRKRGRDQPPVATNRPIEVIELDDDDDDDEVQVLPPPPQRPRTVIDLVADDSEDSAAHHRHHHQPAARRRSGHVMRAGQHRGDHNRRIEAFNRMREDFQRRAEERMQEFARRNQQHQQRFEEEMRRRLREQTEIRRRSRRMEVPGHPDPGMLIPGIAEARAQILATLERIQAYQFHGLIMRRGCSKEVINSLPTYRVPAPGAASSSSSSSGSEEEEVCAICLENYSPGQKVSKLPCSHRYHTDCINQWLKENTVCCTCRDDVVSSSTTR